MPTGWGTYVYAVDDSGERVHCPHPGEVRTIQKVTGMDYSEAEKSGRSGLASHCVCLSCWKQFDLDWKRDAHFCIFCHSKKVRTLLQLVGKRCPRCNAGIFESGSPIRWKLDPDWENLPVPQIVKDLTDFANHRKVPESLKAAAPPVKKISDIGLVVLAFELLDWWQGSHDSPDRPLPMSLEMRPQWTWCKVLPVVLQATPMLAELLVIRDDRCWFSDAVTPELLRGIKNYVRKHYVVTLEA